MLLNEQAQQQRITKRQPKRGSAKGWTAWNLAAYLVPQFVQLL
jgi:hypothetical protein